MCAWDSQPPGIELGEQKRRKPREIRTVPAADGIRYERRATQWDQIAGALSFLFAMLLLLGIGFGIVLFIWWIVAD